MKRALNIIVLCCLLYSCKLSNNSSVISLNFKDTTYVKPEILKTEKILSVIWNVKILDSILVLSSDDGTGFIQVFNKNNFKYLYTKGKYGRGPGEISNAGVEYKCIKDSIYIYDLVKSTLFIYDIKHFISDSLILKANNTITFDSCKNNFDMMPLKGHFVSRSFSKARFALFKRNGKYASNYSLFPDYYMTGDNPNLDLERRRYTHIEAKPDMSKFVCVSYIGGTIEIFNIVNDSINKLIEKNYLDPNLGKVENIKSLNQLETKIGFCGLCATDNYIYASYSGEASKDHRKKKSADFVIVFDWNGDPKKIYKVQGGLTGLAVDESQQKMYVITKDPEGCSAIGLVKM